MCSRFLTRRFGIRSDRVTKILNSILGGEFLYKYSGSKLHNRFGSGYVNYMYVCMNHIVPGHLGSVLKQQRSKEAPLPEPIFKKWLGQLIEGLHYIHGEGVNT